jgi:glycosyltransferase involved in cell wall biosynthesis
MIELSVVIPTYNRAERLRACLEALAHQTQPSNEFEVVVVVDGSIDYTTEMLKHLRTPFSLNILFQENKGQHMARNLGVEHARGRYCLFLDDDIMAEPELVAEHLNLHRQQKKVVGIGQIVLRIPENADWFTASFSNGWQQHYEELNQGDREPSWSDCYGGNMSVARSSFLEVGGFAADIRRSHDVELGYRLEQHGLTFAYLPRAAGWQDEVKGVRELAADAQKSGAAWIKLSQRHPAMYPYLLGPFMKASLRESLLREFIWRVGIPPRVLGLLGQCLSYVGRDRKWYRFLFTYFYWCGFRQALPDHSARQRLTRGTPILMYHAFAGPGEPASRFILPIARFESQMKWLKRLGYCVISLDDFLQSQRTYRSLPRRSVVLTIDDGYAEIRTLVYPILQRYAFPTTVFLVSNKVGAQNDWATCAELQGRQLMSWEQIREMSGAAIQFGAHSRTHAMLTSLTSDRAQEEIAGSKSDLESAFAAPIAAFAYPFGEYDAAIQAFVEQAGFLGGCTADPGFNSLATPAKALRRIEVQGTWSVLRFLIALRL